MRSSKSLWVDILAKRTDAREATVGPLILLAPWKKSRQSPGEHDRLPFAFFLLNL